MPVSYTHLDVYKRQVRHDLVGDGTLYYWYEGSSRWESTPADSLSHDLTQRIPTYEIVTELDPDEITHAGYELREGIPCEMCIRDRYCIS